MPERSVLVRCPGCGHLKEVAMSVGQQLQCDVCRTSFFAPIIAPGALPGGEPRDESAAAGPSEVMGKAEEEELPLPQGAGTEAPQRPSPSVSREAETTSWDELSPAEDQGPAESLPMSPAQAATRRPAGVVGPPGREPSRDSRRTTPVLASLGLLAVFALVVVGGIYLVRSFPAAESQPKAAVEKPATGEAGGPQPSGTGQAAAKGAPGAGILWADASTSSQRMRQVCVKVVRATYGPVRAKDLKNRVITTDDDNLIAVTVSVLNQGTLVRPFHNWYGNAFETDMGGEIVAELTDDQGRVFSLLDFEDVASIAGQRLADRIEPHGVVQDTVVFMLPQEVNRKAIKELYLTLPAEAVEFNGFFRFRIPASMVDGL